MGRGAGLPNVRGMWGARMGLGAPRQVGRSPELKVCVCVIIS